MTETLADITAPAVERSQALIDVDGLIIELTREQLGDYTTPMNSATRFAADLECDSIDEIELVMVVESTLNIEINDDQMSSLQTVGACAEMLLADFPEELQLYWFRQSR